MIKLKDINIVNNNENIRATCLFNFEIIDNLQDFIDIYTRQIVEKIVTERLNTLLTDKHLMRTVTNSVKEKYFKDKLVEKIINELKERESNKDDKNANDYNE
jgi:hypothetical protein